MPFFSRVFKHKDSAGPNGKRKAQLEPENGHATLPIKPRFTASWTTKEIDPEEVEELIHACTLELKSRAEALDSPFLLLPFRPETDVNSARAFIQNFYTLSQGGSMQYTGASLRKELVLTEPAVLCSILKWCWSRLPGGVVTWNTYEGFRMGEQDSRLARNAFSTFVPLSVDSSARKTIIFDFFDLLAAVAAHAKLNGLGGRKLSRMAGWWAFDHSDGGKGFDGGYKCWTTAADASSHLFFAYLRSLEPESLDGFTGINALPRSLKSLLAQTDYPPETPTLMQKSTPKVVMLVEKVSPGPFALLRRAKHFEYRDEELQAFSEYDDPVDALTEECKRVLHCIATANQSTAARSRSGMNITLNGLGSKPDESWSRFQDFGFSDFSDSVQNGRSSSNRDGLMSAPRSRATNKGRPTTPSWADFLNSGFADEATTSPTTTTLLLPPDKVLPPLVAPKSSDGLDEDNLEPGELASITTFDLDDTFWWVWITSLASEEHSDRKAVFGRCALIETGILGGRWLVMEEQVKGAAMEPAEGAYIAEKKSRFGFSRRNKSSRRRSMVPQKGPESVESLDRSVSPTKGSIPLDQQARIRSAAAVLAQQSKDSDLDQHSQRRGRHGEEVSMKTNSIMTLGLTSEAGPAMKWARDFDRDAVRKQYLGDDFTGKGGGKDMVEAQSRTRETSRSVTPAPLPEEVANRELPPVPSPEVKELPKSNTVLEASAPVVPVSTAFESEKRVTPEPVHEPEPSTAPPPIPDPVPVVPASDSVFPSAPMPALETAQPEATSSSPAPQIERKPVPKTAPRLNNIHDHPAFRNKATGPAERAAQQAWGTESRAYSPEPLRKNQNGGFRRMFGMKEKSPPSSYSALKTPSETNVGRKVSLLRKKTPTGPAQHLPVAPLVHSSSNHSPEPIVNARAADPPTPGVQEHDSLAEGSLSRVDTQDRADAEHAFSRFDQGPLREAPAFTPRESIGSMDMPVSPVDEFHHVDAPGAFPETPMDYPSPIETSGYEDVASEASVPNDRWAQIKRNAAERVARMSEDQGSRPTQSILTERTEDDGETSGEETIEARVARIKARVALLTGNIESNNGVRD